MQFQLAVTDISPNYAGIVVAVVNTVSGCAGFLTPIITAEILDGNVGRVALRTAKKYSLKQKCPFAANI